MVEVTDGTAEHNADRYRVSFFYDLAKTSVTRMAFAQAEEPAPHGATAVSPTPGWMRSEIMLDHFGVAEADRRDAPAAEPHFAISETPAYTGRAVAAPATDPDVARWNGRSLSSGRPARGYGFMDVDGSRPDAWRYIAEVREAGRPADVTGPLWGAQGWSAARRAARVFQARVASCRLKYVSGSARSWPEISRIRRRRYFSVLRWIASADVVAS